MQLSVRTSEPSLLPCAHSATTWLAPGPGCSPHPTPKLVPTPEGGPPSQDDHRIPCPDWFPPLMVPTPDGGLLLSCSSRPALMLVPTPDANRASPRGTSALEALRQEQARAPNMLGRRGPKRHTGRNLSSPSRQAPRGYTLAAQDHSGGTTPLLSAWERKWGPIPLGSSHMPLSSLNPSQGPTRRRVGRKLIQMQNDC